MESYQEINKKLAEQPLQEVPEHRAKTWISNPKQYSLQTIKEILAKDPQANDQEYMLYFLAGSNRGDRKEIIRYIFSQQVNPFIKYSKHQNNFFMRLLSLQMDEILIEWVLKKLIFDVHKKPEEKQKIKDTLLYKDNNSNTLFHCLAANPYLNITMFKTFLNKIHGLTELLEIKEQISDTTNAVNGNGLTPFGVYISARKPLTVDLEIIKDFLTRGSDINIKIEGKSLFMYFLGAEQMKLAGYFANRIPTSGAEWNSLSQEQQTYYISKGFCFPNKNAHVIAITNNPNSISQEEEELVELQKQRKKLEQLKEIEQRKLQTQKEIDKLKTEIQTLQKKQRKRKEPEKEETDTQSPDRKKAKPNSNPLETTLPNNNENQPPKSFLTISNLLNPRDEIESKLPIDNRVTSNPISSSNKAMPPIHNSNQTSSTPNKNSALDEVKQKCVALMNTFVEYVQTLEMYYSENKSMRDILMPYLLNNKARSKKRDKPIGEKDFKGKVKLDIDKFYENLKNNENIFSAAITFLESTKEKTDGLKTREGGDLTQEMKKCQQIYQQLQTGGPVSTNSASQQPRQLISNPWESIAHKASATSLINHLLKRNQVFVSLLSNYVIRYRQVEPMLDISKCFNGRNKEEDIKILTALVDFGTRYSGYINNNEIHTLQTLLRTYASDKESQHENPQGLYYHHTN